MKKRTILLTLAGVCAVALTVAYSKVNSSNASDSNDTIGSIAQTTSDSTTRSSVGSNDNFTTENNGEFTRSNGQFTTESNRSTTPSPQDSRNMPAIGRAPGMTDSASSTNTDIQTSIGRAPGITDTTNTNTNFRTAGERGVLGVQSMSVGERLPRNASLISRGEVIGVNESGKTISVREGSTGPITTYSINDSSMLQNINLGETVQIFSQPN